MLGIREIAELIVSKHSSSSPRSESARIQIDMEVEDLRRNCIALDRTRNVITITLEVSDEY